MTLSNRIIGAGLGAAILAAALGGWANAQSNNQSDAGVVDLERPWTQPATPEGEPLLLGEIEARLIEEGLEVEELDRDGRIVEAKARDAQGRWYEIDLNAYTGEIVRTEQDDD